jgi:hypothetical protein
MNTSTKRIIIIGLIVCFVIVPVGLSLWLSWQHKSADQSTASTHNPPKRSDDELMTAITSSLPAYTDDSGHSTIDIVSSSRPAPNWYIVKIIQKGDSSDNYAKVLLNDPYTSASGLRVVLGPGTSFSSDDTAGKGIPDVVLKELNG